MNDTQGKLLTLPELALVVLIGASGSGKSTFARKHFKSTEILSSDYCRGVVSDDENDQAATNDAFEVLHFIAGKRLAAGKLTVIDATNVQPESRKSLVALAQQYHCLPVAIVLDLPERICYERNRERAERNFGTHVIHNQIRQLHHSLRGLKREGFRHIYTLTSPEDVDSVTITREPLWNNRKSEHGPFDIIGDVHGCYDELVALLQQLGYISNTGKWDTASPFQVSHPAGRKVIFLGDLVDRGPYVPAVLRLAMQMTADGAALCVPGNHDAKLLRKLQGKDVQISHGLAESIAQLALLPPEFVSQAATFIDNLVSHYVLDDGKLVVAHAGMKEEMQGRGSGKVHDFALYGETSGETDEFGLPVRYNWAMDYRGKAMVVYGHTPVPEPEWLNRTIDIDTGCVFGGRLTALRYPEKEPVSVPAARVYAEPAKAFLNPQGAPVLTSQQQHDDVLEIGSVIGKRQIDTRFYRAITIREENAITALEVMSRYAVNPKWLIYLPPTMSPCETHRDEGDGEASHSSSLLEHPEEAFAYYLREGQSRVICEEKHMGSRAVVVICRNEEVARKRFGIIGEGIGVCYTRTGRRFFDHSPVLEAQLLERLNTALSAIDLWDEFKTDWFCLDCELLPWSAKAQELLRSQYAAVGAAASAAMRPTLGTLQLVAERGIATEQLEEYQARAGMAQQFVNAYQRYCWPVHTIEDYKLAPFHLLASEGGVHMEHDHSWHMQVLTRLCQADLSILRTTQHRIIDVTDATSRAEGTAWWTELTGSGGEGMVVKPIDFTVKGRHGLIQPGVKCRGREYLRIIYGPEYTMPENLARLRSRGLAVKRSLALREFALGIESLERFVRKEPLYRVHECVFGVLALESEPVDPRL